MRFGVVLAPAADGSLEPLAAQALDAEHLGFDMVWMEERHTGDDSSVPNPAVVAAAVGASTSTIRIGVTVDAGPHPVELAEGTAVADLSTGGRLIVAVRSDDPDLLAETLDVLVAAQSPRPFRHAGPRWRIPANLEANAAASEQEIRVTPLPAQVEVPLWATGPAGSPVPAVAHERGLAYLGAEDESVQELASAWRATERRLGPAAARLRRPAVRRVPADDDGGLDVVAVVSDLLAHRSRWGLDTVLLRLPEQLPAEARHRGLVTLAAEVWPRVQLDQLPPGLDDFWHELHQPRTTSPAQTITELTPP